MESQYQTGLSDETITKGHIPNSRANYGCRILEINTAACDIIMAAPRDTKGGTASRCN
jgi:hypothetical protein